MSNGYDVIISGAGPCGSLLAYHLCRQNIKSLVLEKGNFPRIKICAGGLQYRTAALVEKKIQAVNFSYRSQKIRKRRYYQTIMHTVERRRFDHFLALRAERSGCDYRYGCRVKDFDVAEKKITVRTAKGIFEAKILVGAGGINGAVHKKLLSGRPLYKILGYNFECRAVGWDKKFETDDHIALDLGGVN